MLSCCRSVRENVSGVLVLVHRIPLHVAPTESAYVYMHCSPAAPPLCPGASRGTIRLRSGVHSRTFLCATLGTDSNGRERYLCDHRSTGGARPLTAPRTV